MPDAVDTSSLPAVAARPQQLPPAKDAADASVRVPARTTPPAPSAADEIVAQVARQAVSQTAHHARLSYDEDERRTYVEVLDPRTGDVLFRFPPEAMEKHLSSLVGNGTGALIDREV